MPDYIGDIKLGQLEQIEDLLEARAKAKSESDEADARRKMLDAEIEDLVGIGCHQIGGYSITVADTKEDRFDSTRFKKEHPEMVEEYTETRPKHVFKIMVLKSTKNN
jgi:predicted phage-related endonuclease